MTSPNPNSSELGQVPAWLTGQTSLAHATHARLLEQLVVTDAARQLYHTSATFHAAVYTLAQTLPAAPDPAVMGAMRVVVDALADGCTALQHEDARAVHHMENGHPATAARFAAQFGLSLATPILLQAGDDGAISAYRTDGTPWPMEALDRRDGAYVYALQVCS